MHRSSYLNLVEKQKCEIVLGIQQLTAAAVPMIVGQIFLKSDFIREKRMWLCNVLLRDISNRQMNSSGISRCH